MKKLILSLFIVFFLSSFISGICDEGQVDINTASLTELDELYGIGPAKANAIIDARPFESVNDLINVYGIGEITLDKILDQELACVTSEEESEEETIKEITQESIEEYVEESDYAPLQNPDELRGKITPKVISLTPKDIKSEENTESLDKTDYAKYGFIGFCILIGVLLILKNKRKYKNGL